MPFLFEDCVSVLRHLRGPYREKVWTKVEDLLCTDEAYRAVYREAGLEAIEVLAPVATGDEPYSWMSETQIAPRVIYVL